ncbi:hypothetical protein EL26_09485 [Tumebacillus flagellatus]|uniref:Uncharacterized protein n=1 Tax=Tumebacillus flagellatus TaxID=1157490 RepID=A0A074MCP5_9BACL|nr:hypothetical protein EL26_09485 [Tumebacillus flagellatus]
MRISTRETRERIVSIAGKRDQRVHRRAESDRPHVGRAHSRFEHGMAHAFDHRLQDLLRVLFRPRRMRLQNRIVDRMRGYDSTTRSEHDRFGGRRADIKPHHHLVDCHVIPTFFNLFRISLRLHP